MKADYLNQYVTSYKFTRQEPPRTDRRPMVKLSIVTGLRDGVRCFVSKQQNNWDEHLPQLAGAIRSSVNRSTGFTPNMLMLGREVNQPADLLYRTPDAKTDDSLDD